jgi:hypothetical protein
MFGILFLFVSCLLVVCEFREVSFESLQDCKFELELQEEGK